MSVKREISSSIEKDFFKGKIIVILGARQVGKSTLIKMLPACNSNKTLWLVGENAALECIARVARKICLVQAHTKNAR